MLHAKGASMRNMTFAVLLALVPAAHGASAIPPEVARYLQGPPPESRQFDFLLGDWDVAATRYGDDGAVLVQYRARWTARSLNGGRMVMDDFQARLPGGEAMSSFVTLRTNSELTHRWEIAGLGAHLPAAIADWHGQWQDGEMRLEAAGKDAQGLPARTRIRFFDIGPDGFSWEIRISRDDGRTWSRSASLKATRAAP
jgi:hypothetical protein